MNNVFSEISNFFNFGTSMSPKASWLLIGLLFAGVVILVYGIREIDEFSQLAAYNFKSSGIKGIWYALRGLETYEILKEKVISITNCPDFGYKVSTTNGKEVGNYYIIPSKFDDEDEYFRVASDLAGNDEELKKELLPKSRVRKYFSLIKGEKIAEFLLVYLKNNDMMEVEEALNEYFENEYHKALRTRRKTA